MDLSTGLAIATAVATVVTAIAVVATFFVYRRQAMVMEAQLEVARQQILDLQDSRSAQQLYEVISKLLDIQGEIETILALRDKPFSEWASQELDAAHVVSARFHLSGLLVAQGIVPEELFSKAWFYSVPHCHTILKPFLEHVRKERDHRYWSGFEVLLGGVAKHTATFQGFAHKSAA